MRHTQTLAIALLQVFCHTMLGGVSSHLSQKLDSCSSGNLPWELLQPSSSEVAWHPAALPSFSRPTYNLVSPQRRSVPVFWAGADPGILKGGFGGIFFKKGRGVQPLTREQFVLQINKIFSKKGGGGGGLDHLDTPPRSAPVGDG